MLFRFTLAWLTLMVGLLMAPTPSMAQGDATDDAADDAADDGWNEVSETQTGRLRVLANTAGAEVLIDGDLVGNVPWEGTLDAGSHRVEVRAEHMKRYRGDVTVRPGQVVPVDVRLEPEVSRGGAWATLIMGVACAGAGVALWYIADDIESDLRLELSSMTLVSNDPDIDKGRWMYIGADVAFGMAAVLGVMSLIYFIRDPHPDSSANVGIGRRISLMPSFDPIRREGGAELRWSF